MDLLCLSEMPLNERLAFVASRRDWLRRILPYRALLHPLFIHACTRVETEPEDSVDYRIAKDFLDNLLHHLHSPSEIAELCDALRPVRMEGTRNLFARSDAYE
jgi:hypothetical protein